MKKKKILHIIGGMDRGGAESYIMNTLRNINHDKYKFGILTFLEPRDGKKYVFEDELRKMGVELVRVPDNRFKHPNKFINDVAKVVREGGYDIVHSHIDFMSSLSLAGARKGGVKKRIAHSHNTNNSKIDSAKMRAISKILRGKLNREATDRIACGEDAGHYLFGDKAEFTVVHNGIDLQKFRYDGNKRRNLREKLKIPEDATVFLNIGRLEPQKNQEHLIDIFADYVRKYKTARLIIVGEGSLEQNLRDKIASEYLEDSVMLLPAQDEMERFYSAADLFILPSLFEGVPTVGIEAQASGLKCLFSDKVPIETKLLDSAEFLPLEGDDWLDHMKISKTKRNDAINDPKVKEYDIKNTVLKLEEVYDK